MEPRCGFNTKHQSTKRVHHVDGEEDAEAHAREERRGEERRLEVVRLTNLVGA